MVTPEQLLKESQTVAISALKNFFTNLGFNDEAFEHLYNIELFIGPIATPKVDAIYCQLETKKEDPTDNTIIVNNKMLDKYANLINTNKVKENQIILHIATIIVHEMIHANRSIILDYVEKERNKNTQKISNINDKPKEIWKSKTNVLSEFYHKTDKLSEEYESDRIYYQGDFEEVITDTLAVIIVKTRNDKELNLEEVNNDLQNSKADAEIKIGSKLLTNMGIDTIKWFMTAAYENNYYDQFEHTFKDRYDDLVYDISDIHSSVYCEEEINNFSLKEANQIIEEKTSNKR